MKNIKRAREPRPYNLLDLARRSIESKLFNKPFSVDESTIPESLKEELACFVTLHLSGDLRGCIGHIMPIQPLYKDVIENAKAAAFRDPRFPPLTESEWKKVDLEISILTRPTLFEYQSTTELIAFLKNHRPGVIISKNYNHATFLPQVWEELPLVDEFMAHLCLKAGLDENDWKQPDITIELYYATVIK